MSSPVPPRSAGFTVLEMAISLAIAGAALVVLLKLLSTTLIASERADLLASEAMIARSKLVETVALDPVALGSQAGTEPNGIRWQVEVSQLSGASASQALGRSLVSVTVSVFDPGAGDLAPRLQMKSLAYLAAE